MKQKLSRKEVSPQRRSNRIANKPTENIGIDSENSKSPLLICHLCLSKSEFSRPLFEERSKAVLENIRTVFQIEVNPSDDKNLDFEPFFFQPIQDEAVPDQICTHCIEKIDEFIAFRQMVVENHQKLQLQVEEAKQVVAFEHLVKLEDSEGEEVDLGKKKEAKQAQRKLLKKRKRKSNIELFESGKDDEYDVLLKKYFTFECSQCNLEFPRFHALRRHTYTEHSQKELSIKCYRPDCDAVFAKRAKLLDHLKKHGISTFRFYCQICDKRFDQRSVFKAHIEQSSCVPNSNTMLQCHYCAAFYNRKGMLKRHFQTNHGFEIFTKDTRHKCKDCHKCFASKSSLLTHVQVIHERKEQEMCHICAKFFSAKWALKFHYKTVHEPKPQAMCPVCGKKLSGKDSLSKHLRRSHQQQPMKCEICSKELRNREALVSHKRRMHAPPHHACSLCQKAFLCKAKLAEHMITTHGVGGDLYRCEWCDKTFNFSSSKSLHKKTQHPVEWLQSRDETYRWAKKVQQKLSQKRPETSTEMNDFVDF